MEQNSQYQSFDFNEFKNSNFESNNKTENFEESQNQDFPIISWGDTQSTENTIENKQDNQNIDNSSINEPSPIIKPPSLSSNTAAYSYLGENAHSIVAGQSYYLNLNNNNTVLEEFNIIPKTQSPSFPGVYDFNPLSDSGLGNVINSIFKITSSQLLKIQDCYLFENTQEIINFKQIFSDPSNPQKEFSQYFIYFLSGTPLDGEISLDFNILDGPRLRFFEPAPQILNIFPSWLPITINNFNQNSTFKAIIGSLSVSM
jgi:hypothetical protein